MPLEPSAPPPRPYDGSLCDETCDRCGHQHCHDHTGRCLSGHPLPLVGEDPPPRCPCPFPHGIQASATTAAPAAPTESPRVRVGRDSFFLNPSGGHLRWSEGSPPSSGHEHEHGADCGCTLSVTARPIGTPESIRQEVRIVWDDCVIALEDDVAEPWVTFHKAGGAEGWIERYRAGVETDDDHAYVIFDGEEQKAKIEVTSPGFGLVDCVLLTLFLGNQIDTSRMYNGFMPSRVVDLSAIAADQAWIYQDEALRVLSDADEVAAVRDAFRLAREVRQLARPYFAARDVSVDDVRIAAEGDASLLATASDLRRVLSRFAIGVEGTELFRLAKEMEDDLEARRSRWPNNLEES